MNGKTRHVGGQDGCRTRVVHRSRVERARQEEIPTKTLQRLTVTFKLMGDPTRLKLVVALRGGEMCVCDLAAYLGLTDSAVSHHLRRLKDLALVKHRRAGQVLYYSLNDQHVVDLLNLGLEHAPE